MTNDLQATKYFIRIPDYKYVRLKSSA